MTRGPLSTQCLHREGKKRNHTPTVSTYGVECTVCVCVCGCVNGTDADTTVYKTNLSLCGAHMFVEENK